MPNPRHEISPRGLRTVALVFSLLAGSGSLAVAAEALIRVLPGTRSGLDARTAATIDQALLIARGIRARDATARITIQLPSGSLRRTEPIVLRSADSGTAEAPLIIRGAADGTTFSGAIDLPVTQATTTSMQADGIAGAPADRILLAEHLSKSLQHPPTIVRRGFRPGIQSARFLLFQGEQRLRPARWPKSGYLEHASQQAEQAGESTVRIDLDKSSYGHLAGQPDLWFGGFWNAAWDYETNPAIRFDDQDMAIGFAPSGGGKARKDVRLFAFNVASALSEPGEYVLLPDKDRAFVLPEDNPQPVEMAMAEQLLEIDGAHDIRLENIAFEKTLGDTVRINGSTDIVLQDCFIGRSGQRAVVVDAGAGVIVRRCIVTDTSEGAVSLSGGDRQNLHPSRHAIEDSVVMAFGLEAWTYRPGVELAGVGQRVTGCYVASGAHAGIIVTGNDHWITGNEFADLLTETDDAGAIYMGRDWTARGQLIANNYFHDLGGRTAQVKKYIAGVYLDDQFSGVTVEGNYFDRVPLPIMIGGGRDNLIASNVFLEPGRGSVFLDDRGLTWQKHSKALQDSLAAVPVDGKIYRARYPGLAAMEDDEPGAPKGNRLIGNVTIDGKPLFLKGVKATDLAANQNGQAPLARTVAALIHARSGEQIEAAAHDDPSPTLKDLKIEDRAGLLRQMLFKDRLSPRLSLPWQTP